MKKLLSPLWALLTLILLASAFYTKPVFLESIKLNYFDTLIKSKEPTDNNIYAVNIDEATLDQYGQYPFPRDVYANIIEDLYNRGAGLVVFNVLMPEADRFKKDQVLANLMQQVPVVLPSALGDKTKNSPRNPGASVINSEFMYTIPQADGIIANIPELENSAIGVGIVGTFQEVDGVNRRLPTVVAVGDTLYPSMALEVLRIVAGDPSFQIKLQPNGIEKMRIPAFGMISTESDGRVWIDWSQRNKQASAVDLPKDLGGAVVIVGVTAAGLANPVPTPLGAMFAQDMQAAVIGTMFNGVNIQRPDWAEGAELLIILVGGALIILLSRWTYVGLSFTAIGVIAVVPASWYLFNSQLMLVDATSGLISFTIVALHTYGIKFVREFLEKQAIKKQFEGYASPTVVKLLQTNPDLIKKGVKKEVSILFSDLRGFTPLGESFGDDVEGLTKIMNGYMDTITQPVLNNNGMIIKYIGDASMHIHNAPIDDPDHPATCVRTGLQMLKAVEEFNVTLQRHGRPPVGMGAGINTGLGYIGEMGSTRRHSYDVLGDAVSTAARIESKCKEYGCLLLVGGATVERCKDEFFFLKVDDLAVKGKTVGIPIYTVLDTDPGAMSEYLMAQTEHDRMHHLYRSQDFDGAIKMCNGLKCEFDGKMEKYYDMWIERCEFMKTQPLPKDWDGIFHATTK